MNSGKLRDLRVRQVCDPASSSSKALLGVCSVPLSLGRACLGWGAGLRAPWLAPLGRCPQLLALGLASAALLLLWSPVVCS